MRTTSGKPSASRAPRGSTSQAASNPHRGSRTWGRSPGSSPRSSKRDGSRPRGTPERESNHKENADMVVVMGPNAGAAEIDGAIKALEGFGFTVHRSTGVTRTVLGVIGKTGDFDTRQVELLPGVESVARITEPYKLASRTFRQEDSVIRLKDVQIGGGHFVTMAGPCSVETPEQVHAVARVVKEGGAQILRGGAFKP